MPANIFNTNANAPRANIIAPIPRAPFNIPPNSPPNIPPPLPSGFPEFLASSLSLTFLAIGAATEPFNDSASGFAYLPICRV